MVISILVVKLVPAVARIDFHGSKHLVFLDYVLVVFHLAMIVIAVFFNVVCESIIICARCLFQTLFRLLGEIIEHVLMRRQSFRDFGVSPLRGQDIFKPYLGVDMMVDIHFFVIKKFLPQNVRDPLDDVMTFVSVVGHPQEGLEGHFQKHPSLIRAFSECIAKFFVDMDLKPDSVQVLKREQSTQDFIVEKYRSFFKGVLF